MKKKYMAIVLGMSVALASVTGCGGQTEQTQTTVETTAEADASEETEAQADVIYGEVASVTDTSVTIQVGTMKEGGATEKPDDANGADSALDGMPEDQPSILELDGTEQTIAVTADTVITRQQMVVDGGRYTSNGTGSPAIYSTADISIHNAELTANNSEAVCIEGLNSLRLYECDLTGSMQDLSQNDCTWNVILYQSMSGDSEVGNSTFEMIGGSLTAKNGGMFYTTNTESSFYLENVAITNADNSDFFLKCTGNENQRGWGAAGANGADCLFTAKDQEMEGDVIWDSISQLDFYLTGNSTLTGAFVQDESCAGNGGDGYANLYIGENSTWVVTGDSAVTNLSCSGKIVDADGNTVTVKGTDGTVYVKGDSSYTITVKSWSDSADLSGAGSADSWSDHEEQKEMDEIARLF